MRIITLLTDFGRGDWFVASMKGVILSIAPRAQIVDITHDIPPQAVQTGAFVLSAAAADFPPGTVHVAVVDPGVGTARRAIAVRTPRAVFVGPDNGVLSLAAAGKAGVEIREITNDRLFRRPVSRTFHGRDVFAPVAAHLVRGVPFATVGPRRQAMQRLVLPEPQRQGRGWRGCVVFVDRFGNLVTNLTREMLPSNCRIRVGGRMVGGLSGSYGAVPRGRLVAVINSIGRLEIGLRDGSAARRLGVGVGTAVSVRSV